MRTQDLSLNRKALYEVIADKLEEMILNDKTNFAPKLPSEQRLAESFSVSRPVIREALKLLKERGLIESRQGASSVITEYSPQNLFKSISRFTQTQNVQPEQIHQVRTALELISVRAAAENAEKEDIFVFKEMHAALQKCVNLDESPLLDIALHKMIAKASKNPLLECIYAALTDLIQPLIQQSSNMQTVLDGIQWHEKIIDAIEKGNAEQAVTYMQQHLLLSIRNFEFLNDDK